MIDWGQYPNFSHEEFQCRCGCGQVEMDPEFISILQSIRNYTDHSMHINSGYRCPSHNNKVSSTGFTGPHTTGKAADIKCNRAYAYDIMIAGGLYGITGFGFQQRGSHRERFIHLDTLKTELDARPRVWTY